MPKRIEGEPPQIPENKDQPITFDDLMKAMDELAKLFGLSKEEVEKLKEKHNLSDIKKDK